MSAMSKKMGVAACICYKPTQAHKRGSTVTCLVDWLTTRAQPKVDNSSLGEERD